MNEFPTLKWTRPDSSEYPKVWHTFTARDSDSDRLVEYRIEDLTECKSEEALKIMVQYFCNGEPLCIAYGVPSDPVAEKDLEQFYWSPAIKQKMVLVCYKSGSDEIVGLNMNFVLCKDDRFFEEIQKQFSSEKNIRQFFTLSLLNEDFDTFERYGIEKYLTSAGLTVTPKYRGRGIGEQFLKSRAAICKELGIKLTSTSFTSEFSNRIADKVGFKLDKIISFKDVREKHPELRLPEVESETMTLKSILFEN